jgi:hypothetical protein
MGFKLRLLGFFKFFFYHYLFFFFLGVGIVEFFFGGGVLYGDNMDMGYGEEELY